MDKYCGNESKIRLTRKICRFTPIFVPPELLTKNHAKMGTFLNIFFFTFLTKKFPELVNSRKNHSHPILHTNEVTPKAQSELDNFLTPLQIHNGRHLLGLIDHMNIQVYTNVHNHV